MLTRTRPNESDDVFVSKTEVSPRTLAARKAAETRRSRLQAKKWDERLNTYRFAVDLHGHFWSLWRFDRRKTILREAIAEVIESSRFQDGDGYDLPDVAVWLVDKLVATIRLGENGDPVVTIFADAQ